VTFNLICDLNLVDLSANGRWVRIPNAVKRVISELISGRIDNECLLLNMCCTTDFVPFVLNTFEVLQTSLKGTSEAMAEITLKILRNPFLRRQIATGLGISVQKLLNSLLNRIDDNDLGHQSRGNERNTLELSALLAEDLFIEGFVDDSVKSFRHVCALAHLRLGGENVCFIRIVQCFRFLLGQMNEHAKALNLFIRVTSLDLETTRFGVVYDDSFKKLKLFYSLKERNQLPDVPLSFELENEVFRISDNQSIKDRCVVEN